ncbi:fibronectin type III domain-containing protein [Paenibacillus amylolyticus]|nr:fibronectin type III domain-containing protein [Paenibacillus amylolyticus]
MSKPVSPAEVLVDSGVHHAKVSWSEVEGAAEYVIEQKGKEIYRGIENEATITGLQDGTWHHYQLWAVNRQGTRSEATEVSLLTLPQKPVKVAVYDVAKNSLGLDFSNTGVQGADHYVIEQDGREIAQMDSSETQFVDKDLSPGTKYTYVIRAVNAEWNECAAYVQYNDSNVAIGCRRYHSESRNTYGRSGLGGCSGSCCI